MLPLSGSIAASVPRNPTVRQRVRRRNHQMLLERTGIELKDMRVLLLLFIQFHKPIRYTRIIKGTLKGINMEKKCNRKLNIIVLHHSVKIIGTNGNYYLSY